MRPLIIDEGVKASLKKMVDYAKANIVDVKNPVVAGDNAGHVTILPFGYKVVFSIEDQLPGLVWHLSVSVNTPGKVPNPLVCEELIKQIGFKNEMHDCRIDLEDIGPNHQAISLMELHEPA